MSKVKNKTRRIETFSIIHPNTAAIDVGDKEMVTAVGADRCQNNVRTFGSFTCDYIEISEWLKQCRITHVAMECTGIYWVQLYMHLMEEGFEVMLANAKHVKNVSGRKDDEIDAVWLQKLHSVGLIKGSFQPDLPTRELRDIMRHRRSLVQDSSRCINRIIKILELMNIKVQTVISDIDGKTGRNIIEAILCGQRDPTALASLADKRIRAPKETLIKSLEANWSDHQLFLLQQQYDNYQFLSQQITQCDGQIEKQLLKMLAHYNDGIIPVINHDYRRKRSTRKNPLNFNATAYLVALLKTDLTKIPAIQELTALEFISEVGIDMSKWPCQKQFLSWLAIVPNTKKSGGKIISNKIMKKKHRAGQCLRVASGTLYRSRTPLGDYFRRKRARGGPATAIVATATKIAIAIYMMIKNKTPYQPQKMIENQHKAKQILIQKLEKKLAKLKAA